MISDQYRRMVIRCRAIGYSTPAIAKWTNIPRHTIAAIIRDARIRAKYGWGMDQKHWIVIREKNVPCPCGCHGAHYHHYWRYPRRVLLRSPTRGVVQLPWMPRGVCVPVRLAQVGLFESARSEWRLEYPKRDCPPIKTLGA